MSKYKVGDRVWLARAGTEEIKKPCPVCYGKLSVRLILGNDDVVELPCDYCGKGFEGPRGWVTEYEYSIGAENLVVREVRSEITDAGETNHYLFSGGRYADSGGDIFDTEQEALTQCQEVKARLEEEQRTRAEYIKAKDNMTFAWNAGYHLREAKREEASAARHRERAKLCKERAENEQARRQK